MTRKEMEEVIAGGGSVLHEGRLHVRVETLPSTAALASSNEDKAAAAGELDAQIAKLTAERDALKAAGDKGGKSDEGDKTKGKADPKDGDKTTGKDGDKGGKSDEGDKK